jgi:DNA-binding NtrC family response regulator
VEASGLAPFDLVITAQNLPDGKGLQLLSACRDADPALPVVILTGVATV